jgi:DDE superfamily endonuclease
VKVVTIATSDTYIHYVSPTYAGKIHDFTLLKDVFPPEKTWFKKFTIRVDLGFLGFDKKYACKKLIIPEKKKKKKKLTKVQKERNKKKSQKRIFVEHSIGGMKRYLILSDRLRTHDAKLYDSIVEICAGLWNFNLKFK